MNSTSRPQILLTNDDSINSPGLWAAAEALESLGFVNVVAPRSQHTSMGRAHPQTSDGRIDAQIMVVNGKEWQVYAVGGSPAQSVLHGVLDVLKYKPDLVVSGINYGENVGSGMTISGTVGAALEASTMGVPTLAASLQTPTSAHYNLSKEVDFAIAAYFTHVFAQKILEHPMPFDVDVLNLNVPADATRETPWVLTRQSRQRYFYPVDKSKQTPEEQGKISYEARVDLTHPEPETDIWVIAHDHLVSVTPLSFDMTSRVNFEDLRKLLES